MGMATTGNHASHGNINVTPLIDVLLVLLIIFMVIQPGLVHGLEAVAPHPAADATSAPDPRTVVIRVSRSAEGQPLYRLNNDAVAREALADSLRRIFAQRGDDTVFVQGDDALDYQQVLEVVNQAHAADVQNIGLLTPATLMKR